MTADTPREPVTEAGRRLLAGHGHRSVEGDEPGTADNLWCATDDESWPCPFAQNLAAIEAEARGRQMTAPLSTYAELLEVGLDYLDVIADCLVRLAWVTGPDAGRAQAALQVVRVAHSDALARRAALQESPDDR